MIPWPNHKFLSTLYLTIKRFLLSSLKSQIILRTPNYMYKGDSISESRAWWPHVFCVFFFVKILYKMTSIQVRKFISDNNIPFRTVITESRRWFLSQVLMKRNLNYEFRFEILSVQSETVMWHCKYDTTSHLIIALVGHMIIYRWRC